MKTIGWFLAIACFVSPLLAQNLEVVLALQAYETTESAMLAEGRYIYFGQSRFDETESHRLHVYDSEQKRIIQSFDVPHSVQHLTAQDSKRIVLSGKTADPWQSHLSLLTENRGRFRMRTFTVPNDQLVEHIAADGQNAIYMTDPGSRSVLKMDGLEMEVFAQQISSPGSLLVKGGKLWVIERNRIEAGDENLLAIDLKTKEVQRFYPRGMGAGMERLADIRGTSLIAINEWQTRTVKLIDTKDFSLVQEIVISGMPEGLASLKQCLLISASDTQELIAVHLASKATRSYSFGAEPERLKSVRHIAVSESGTDVMLRSVWPCPWGCEAPRTYSAVASFQFGPELLTFCK